ncbi:MAG TPA: hypothetical protein VK737_01790 [Opitutales bacterium]|jgi:hypothetical protein|nr:hypothetical protein [Opitutales bacterium]
MQPPINHPHPDAEERFEAWLSSQPLTPAPDFVSRTLARIRAESNMIALAKTGDEAAIDAMLDRWLGESPLEPDLEPAQIATQTRRTAHREMEEESNPAEPMWRRVFVPFPAWARSSVALAAAASVAILAYFSTSGPSVSPVVSSGPPEQDTVVAQVQGTLPAPGSEAYDPNALVQLNDSLKDGKVLLDSDILSNLPGSDPATDDTAVE